MPDPTEVIHIADPDVEVNQHLRQRCAWCGATLVDYNLAAVAVPIGQDSRPSTWPVGALVVVCGPGSWTVDHEDAAPLPPRCCAVIDPDVTK